jgi:hypothetical protein
VLPHEEAHSNDFHSHFPSIDEQEDEINSFDIVSYCIDLLVQSKESTVYYNNEKDETIEQWINGHNLDNFISEWVRNGEAAKRHGRIVLLCLSIWLLIILWEIRQLLFHLFDRLDAKLAKCKSSDLIY